MQGAVVLALILIIGSVAVAKPTKKLKDSTKLYPVLAKNKTITQKRDPKKTFIINKIGNKTAEPNKTEETLVSRSNISENEIYELSNGKASDIDERALVFIEQRYKVPFLHSLSQKHFVQSHYTDTNYRTFLSNSNSNGDMRQIFVHRFPEIRRPPIKSHKDIFVGDGRKKEYGDIYLKDFESIDKPIPNHHDDRPKYSFYNRRKKVNIINSNLNHKYNDVALKDELVDMSFDHTEDMSRAKLLRYQLENFRGGKHYNDAYRRSREHEIRESKIYNDIQSIKNSMDSLSAEHREYLELLKSPKKNVLTDNHYYDNDLPKNRPSKPLRIEGVDEKPKVETQYYAQPTREAISLVMNNEIASDHLQSQQQSYLSSPRELDFHDSRILSKIDEMNALSAALDKEKRSTFGSSYKFFPESKRTTRTWPDPRRPKRPQLCMHPECTASRTNGSDWDCDCNKAIEEVPDTQFNENNAFIKPATDYLDGIPMY